MVQSADSKRPFEIVTTPQYDALQKLHAGMKVLPFVPAIRVRSSELIFVSGAIGVPEDYDPRKVYNDSIEVQAERVFAGLSQSLEAAGATLQDVVQITKYMTDLDQHEAVVAVMRRHFGDHLPTSTTVEVKRLVPLGFGLEVDAIAAVSCN